jgi:RimJ/RimL family protein N-acetyltransferase
LADALGPILETERLLLRPPTQEDFPAYADMMADGEHVRFIGGAQLRAPAWRSWAAVAGSWSLLGFGKFSIIEKTTGDWLGTVGPWEPDGWPGKEIGWTLKPSATGKGYVTEAAIASMDFAFDVLHWTKVIHIISPENVASIGVAKRLGSTNLGPSQLPPPMDTYVADNWGQSADQWRARKRT